MTGNMKRRLSILLVLAVALAVLPAVGRLTASSVQAASKGTWVLTKEQVYVRASSSSDRSNDKTGDGSQEISVKSISSDGYQTSTCAYEGKADDKVKLSYYVAYIGPGDQSAREYYSQCSVPDKSILAGSTVTMKLHLWAGNGTHGFHDNANVYLERPSVGWGGKEFAASGSDNNFKDANGDYFFDNGGKTNSTYEQDITVSAKMPEDNSTLDEWAINYSTSAGMYQWIYKWQAGGSSSTTAPVTTPTPTDGGDDPSGISDADDDIELAQVTGVKLTNKPVKRLYITFGAVDGAEGYEIEYATNIGLSKSKKIKCKATKGYFVNKNGKKASFKKGKTYYARVRAYATDSDGETIYGDWSSMVKAKIKK
ncbi:MAG: hypothetical protein J5819_04185 [Eubacterium sp.]|nr:hypothetical protein [Eubacterium sp.]